MEGLALGCDEGIDDTDGAEDTEGCADGSERAVLRVLWTNIKSLFFVLFTNLSKLIQ